jgi:Domain of unknown function (DUF4136)
MKSTISRIVSITVLACLMICVGTAAAQDVHTDYDHNANFERYHTYSWKMVKTPNSLWDQRVQDAVNEQLQKKGWQLVPSGGDVVLSAIGTTKTETTLQTYYDGPGWGGWGWGGFGTATTVPEQYHQGTLVVDMFVANTKKLLWRGVAQDTLSEKPSKNEKKLEKAVDKMFKDFPPKPKQNKS